MKNDTQPVIVGTAQFKQDKDTPDPLDPLGLMTVSARRAFADARTEELAGRCDTVRVVNIFSHSYRDVCAGLAAALGSSPARSFYSPMGGNTPQLYLNAAAADIAAGRSRMTLIAGAEAGYAIRRARKGEIALDWPAPETPQVIDGVDRPGGSDFEYCYGLLAPAYAYAFFENALRHAAGQSLPDHRHTMGKICERLSRVAAQNPCAWIRQPAGADELTTPSANNRMIGFPYTFRMAANLNVDQTAAVVMTSRAFARELGIPEDRWIYPMGGASFNNIWHVAERPSLTASPALAAAARLAMGQAGIGIGEVGFFDLYSCFPSAVEIARRELGIAAEDPRDISVTGGLAYFGGPGNNYSLHAIASTVDRIRQNRREIGLVTALGWFNTKWAVGIYGAEPGCEAWAERDVREIQARIDSETMGPPVEKAEGKMTVESYVVFCDRHGAPDRASVIGRLADGARTFAFLDAGPERLAGLMDTELIGMRGTVCFDTHCCWNLFRI